MKNKQYVLMDVADTLDFKKSIFDCHSSFPMIRPLILSDTSFTSINRFWSIVNLCDTSEIKSLKKYAETFTEDAEMSNYAEFHAMKLALRGQYDNADNQDNHNLQYSPTINWYALTDAQIAQLQKIAERNTGRTSVMAKGVLCFFFGICYDDDLLMNDNLDNQDNHGGAETRSTNAAQQNGETHLNVYPNPAADVLYVELLGAEIANAAL